jgi:hypothetical protein
MILIGILIFFAVAMIYAIYISEFYPTGTMRKFYVFFSIGMILCLFAITLSPSYKASFVLLISSVFITVYVAEIYLFCCSRSDPDLITLKAQAASAAGLPFDLRTRYQVYLDSIKEGIETYPSISIAQFLGPKGLELEGYRVLPLAGISEKNTLLCNESGEYVNYPSDEHGFNNPTGLYTAGRIDMVLIGDSFTHGACVAPGKDIASHLRKPGRIVINLGYKGNGPLIKLATIKEYVEPLKPKIILWLYYEGNDLNDLAVEEQSSHLLNYLDRNYSQNLYERQSEIDIFLMHYLNKKLETFKKKNAKDRQFATFSLLSKIVRLSHLRTLLGRVFSASPSSHPLSPLFEHILRDAKARTSMWGGKLYFVYLPAWQRYGTKVDHERLFHRSQILATLHRLDIPLIDVHETFSQHPDPLSFFPFRLPGHYLAEGYEMVAATIQRDLKLKHSLAFAK